MSRYKDEQCRICRREGQKLFLKGSRCYSDKCSITRRNYAPGQNGQKKSKISEYGTQLREKQKTKAFYGVGEKQFRRYFDMASNSKGKTGEVLLRGRAAHKKIKIFTWGVYFREKIVSFSLVTTQNRLGIHLPGSRRRRAEIKIYSLWQTKVLSFMAAPWPVSQQRPKQQVMWTWTRPTSLSSSPIP